MLGNVEQDTLGDFEVDVLGALRETCWVFWLLGAG